MRIVQRNGLRQQRYVCICATTTIILGGTNTNINTNTDTTTTTTTPSSTHTTRESWYRRFRHLRRRRRCRRRGSHERCVCVKVRLDKGIVTRKVVKDVDLPLGTAGVF